MSAPVPRNYQIAAVQSIWDYFNGGGRGNPVIALPTGTGKSLIPAWFITEVLRMWPTQRFMILTHVKELIAQNAGKMIEVWPLAPMGIFSAGLKRKDTQYPITFGGVASVYNNVEIFGHIDLLFIDECHLLNPNATGMYGIIIDELRKVNPYLRVIGMSATPFRLGHGRITDGGLFTDLCFNACNVDGFNRLLAEGWISMLIPKRPNTEYDISKVGITNGDYTLGQLQEAVGTDSLTQAVCEEICKWGSNRRKWLAFCSGIEHAEKVATVLSWMGVAAAAVHSKMPGELRDERIRAFKAGGLRCITNNNVLTTGFDDPEIDMIPMLRPTMSPGLWVQMLGRGTRPSPATGKANCLVMDFAGNTRRLGPINDPIIPKKKGEAQGDAPVKICETCGTYNHASVRFCISCGAEFHFQNKIVKTADTQELIKGDFPLFELFDVDRVIYTRYEKAGSPPSIRVSYFCGLRMFNEWLLLQHPGFAGKKARDWWRQRHHSEPPPTTDEAMNWVNDCRAPKQIRVWVNKKYPEVMSYEW